MDLNNSMFSKMETLDQNRSSTVKVSMELIIKNFLENTKNPDKRSL